MFVIEVNMTTSAASWVLDTGCGAHICNKLQVLERRRKLSKDEMILKLGDGKAIAVEVVGSLSLVVSDHIRIKLKDCFIYREVDGLKESRDRRFGQPTNLRVLKMTKKPFVGQSAITNSLSYFITFTDDHSQYGYSYLMRYKSRPLEGSRNADLKLRIKLAARSKSFGRTEVWTPPGTPQLNGVAERRNQTLLDMVQSMMSFTELPPSFWGYALETAAKLLNIAPSKTVPQTPYEIWHGKPASYKYLRVWGSPAYIKRLVGDKLDSRSSLCSVLSDSRGDEVLLEESSEEPRHDRTTSFKPPVLTDSVPVLRRSTRESQVPERDLYGSAGGFHYCWRRTEGLSSPKAIYGLKQASRSWNTRFDEVIRGYDFIKNEHDHCVYRKISGSSIAYLMLYVDDILLIGNEVTL
ncbi:UNVERIFIED_CONTAM: hypothetical protein Slati_2249100 [Sesamum latifolium]|uniref:Integrase catalytic domain-containing protein n=1 Tax=Sesamum latifolium TaxID=2727402 RepID=A0AAW2WTA2_9LAMI